jgi:hypothetical protein
MFTVNDWIATTPFPESGIKTGIRRGVAVIEQTIALTPLKVLHDAYASDGKHLFKSGNTVYVRGEAMKHQWSGEVFEDGGVKFILIPRSIVVAVDE